jgi:hypothetical protein
MRSFEAGPDGMDVICIGGRKPAGGDTEKDQSFLVLRVQLRPVASAPRSCFGRRGAAQRRECAATPLRDG